MTPYTTTKTITVEGNQIKMTKSVVEYLNKAEGTSKDPPKNFPSGLVKLSLSRGCWFITALGYSALRVYKEGV